MQKPSFSTEFEPIKIINTHYFTNNNYTIITDYKIIVNLSVCVSHYRYYGKYQ